MIVELSRKECKEADRLAHARNDEKIKKVKNRRFDKKQDDLDMNRKGILAEMGVYKYLEVSLTEGPFYNISLSGDSGYDLIYKGHTIDVKLNTRFGDLYFNTLEDFKSDIGVLVYPGESNLSVNLIGWLHKKEFERLYENKNWGYGERVCVAKHKLNPMKTLKELKEE